jgi:hypothetical protein
VVSVPPELEFVQKPWKFAVAACAWAAPKTSTNSAIQHKTILRIPASLFRVLLLSMLG